MHRLSVILSVALVIGSIVPTGLAGPTCTKKNWRACAVRSKSGKPCSTTATSAAGIATDVTSFSVPLATFSDTQPTQTAEESSSPVAPPPENTSSAAPPPTSPSAPAPAPSSTAPPPSSEAPSGDIATFLKYHNDIRAKHGAEPLVWDANLASKAQSWADKCVFEHSGGTLGPYGENLAAGTGSEYGIQEGVQDWTNEVSEYNPSAPDASHFTQVVWKATKQLGCAVQTCNGLFDPKFGSAKYIVCEYFPAGNDGTYAQNVQV